MVWSAIILELDIDVGVLRYGHIGAMIRELRKLVRRGRNAGIQEQMMAMLSSMLVHSADWNMASLQVVFQLLVC